MIFNSIQVQKKKRERSKACRSKHGRKDDPRKLSAWTTDQKRSAVKEHRVSLSLSRRALVGAAFLSLRRPFRFFSLRDHVRTGTFTLHPWQTGDTACRRATGKNAFFACSSHLYGTMEETSRQAVSGSLPLVLPTIFVYISILLVVVPTHWDDRV
jgi:hypothetical protein